MSMKRECPDKMFAHVQADVHPHSLRMLEGTFGLKRSTYSLHYILSGNIPFVYVITSLQC